METKTDAHPARRRRGRALEDALLEAAWEQLQRAGYAAFTIDAVARAVNTSRAVIYRRWPSRAALVHATVRAHTGSVIEHVPDTGSLAGDVLAVVHELAGRIEQIGIDVATGLLSELEEIPDDVKAVVPSVFQQVIDRGRTRGELGNAPIPDAVLSMPGALIRYNVIAERAAPSEQALEQIAHQLFLPLVRYHASL
ncbi:TetR/AcrR family transcriptional regulator [Amycolatopsis taiwanensis]|uniref:TetR/AcrR family transcriptional regulator n=1 Tax=Amycolatopsis taiwanensis TaxID=342230 RepID=UPI000482E0E1|nr:TetR/AcrR family transcriptional regulator [Amycolatopsis taiwanensis]